MKRYLLVLVCAIVVFGLAVASQTIRLGRLETPNPGPEKSDDNPDNQIESTKPHDTEYTSIINGDWRLSGLKPEVVAYQFVLSDSESDLDSKRAVVIKATVTNTEASVAIEAPDAGKDIEKNKQYLMILRKDEGSWTVASASYKYISLESAATMKPADGEYVQILNADWSASGPKPEVIAYLFSLGDREYHDSDYVAINTEFPAPDEAHVYIEVKGVKDDAVRNEHYLINLRKDESLWNVSSASYRYTCSRGDFDISQGLCP